MIQFRIRHKTVEKIKSCEYFPDKLLKRCDMYYILKKKGVISAGGIPGEYLMTDSCSFPSVDSEITSLVTKSRTTHLSELKGEADGQGAARLNMHCCCFMLTNPR